MTLALNIAAAALVSVSNAPADTPLGTLAWAACGAADGEEMVP